MKMKGLFWNKLNERQHTFYTTIWYTLHQKADNAVNVKFDKLYELFEDVKKKKKVVKVEEEAPKEDAIALIADDKRVQLLYLSVKKLTMTNKLSYEQIRKMVLNLDDSLIGFDAFTAMVDIAPTRDELTIIKGYDGDPEKLDLPSRWLYEVKDLPRFKKRIELFEFAQTF